VRWRDEAAQRTRRAGGAPVSGRGNAVLALAATAWVVVAIVFATGSISGARTVVPPSGVSPACLPATLNAGATIAGTGVSVSPAPSSDSASPATQISFLGAPATSISNVEVEGSRTGEHAGRLEPYSQGDGASFVAERRFAPGERVRVRAQVGTDAAARSISFSFGVASPYPTDGVPTFPNPPAQPSAVQSFVTAPALHPPALTVTTPDQDPKAGQVMMTVGPGPGDYGPLIFDADGHLEWFDALARGVDAEDLRVQRYEGQDVLTWWQGKVLAQGLGEGEDVIMDSHYTTLATIHAGNGYQADLHDFQIVPGGVAYLTVYDLIRCDLAAVGGVRNGVLIDTAVQAIDMKTGLVRWEWHSLDNVDVRDSHAPVPREAIPWDWFHLNSLDLQSDGRILLSARQLWAAYELDGRSGKVLWQLGGTHSSFAMPAGAETAWQHDARLRPDGTVTLFDNGSAPRVHAESRGLRLALDMRRHSARVVRAYPHPRTPVVADSQGDLQTLPDGNVLVGWGSIPSVSEFAPEGALLFDAHLPPGDASYRAFRFRWSGRPSWPPVASARVLATEDQTAVFASWNGATDVAYWRVLAGTSPTSLTVRATARDSGFESAITYPESYLEHHVEYVAAQALDAKGAVLGTAPTVAVSPPRSAPGS
jgi:Arylsulfotransferase (ASST)